MNSLEISTDPNLLSAELADTLNLSPSVSTFLPEEDASICPLLPSGSSPSPPLEFIHPLTPSPGNDNDGGELTISLSRSHRILIFFSKFR